MVKDPVCGMEIDPAKAHASREAGRQTVYFCSPKCVDEFAKHPEKYGPRPVVARLSALFSAMARAPEMRQKLFAQGWQVAGTSAEGLANRIQADSALLGGIIAAQGIKAE